MSISEQDWKEEQLRVDQVTSKIADRIEQLEDEVGGVRSEVVEIRKTFWEDVTVNFSSADDVIETYTSMKQQAEVLSERERRHRISADDLRKLKRLQQSPYFGRIDFTEEGDAHIEQIYLGIASFYDEESDQFLVYDWRAPISSLYYDYSPGPSAYVTPSGEITGEMLLKRQFVVQDRVIRYMFDTGVTIGDELLQQVLSKSADNQMKSIVATIQKEQNQIIRNDTCRMLIVQGAAGSGKTSSALQRVAYLLYKNRETLSANQIVLFSPNPLFNSYVSTVLPELGEENMQQTTLQDYIAYRLAKEFTLEDPFDQLEYVLTERNNNRFDSRLYSIRYKSSVDFLHAIQAYKTYLEQTGMVFRAVRFEGREIVSAKQIEDMFYSYDASIHVANRVVLLRDWLLQQVQAFAEEEQKAEWVEQEMNVLEPEDYQRAYNQVRNMERGRVPFDQHDKEHDILARMIVDRKLKPIRRSIRRLRFVSILTLYRNLFADPKLLGRIVGEEHVPQNWEQICKVTDEMLMQSNLTYEDSTPYLFLKELVQGFDTNTSVRHVFIDEVQDYSPFQLEFLKRLFPRARMTVLGDLNQTIYAHASALDQYEPLVRLYGADQTELIRLTRSYRSTKQIVEFTKGIIKGGDNIIPFERTGDRPHLSILQDRNELTHEVLQDIRRLQDEGYNSIAVICKTAEESEMAYHALKDQVEVRHIKKTTPVFEKGTLIIPSYLAKGVEFDAVILFDASASRYHHEDERKLFYTACTRAMHVLRLYSIGEPTPFLSNIASEFYTVGHP